MGVCKSKKSRAGSRLTHVWDAACKLDVIRTSPCGVYGPEPLEKGVNYFVLMLEQLGAKPHYSCEGHPNNFYVLFEAPLRIAEAIAECGFFTVELEGKKLWSIRTRALKDDNERVKLLRWAAEQWNERLGPLEALPH
jgi:hypothetical protein